MQQENQTPIDHQSLEKLIINSIKNQPKPSYPSNKNKIRKNKQIYSANLGYPGLLRNNK